MTNTYKTIPIFLPGNEPRSVLKTLRPNLFQPLLPGIALWDI